MTKQDLVELRTRLQEQWRGKQSLLDHLIDAWDARQAIDGTAPTCYNHAAPVSDAAPQIECKPKILDDAFMLRLNRKKPAKRAKPAAPDTKPKKDTGPTAAQMVRDIIARGEVEFSISAVNAALEGKGIHPKAVGSAFNVLKRHGEIERIGYGIWRRTSGFKLRPELSEKERNYLKLRSEIDSQTPATQG